MIQNSSAVGTVRRTENKRRSRGKSGEVAGDQRTAAAEDLLGDLDPPSGDGSKPAGYRYKSSTGNGRCANTAEDTGHLQVEGHNAKKETKTSATSAPEWEKWGSLRIDRAKRPQSGDKRG